MNNHATQEKEAATVGDEIEPVPGINFVELIARGVSNLVGTGLFPVHVLWLPMHKVAAHDGSWMLKMDETMRAEAAFSA